MLVDANVLLYAVNEAEPRHDQALRWLDSSLAGVETVGFTWAVLLAFVRLSTKWGCSPGRFESKRRPPRCAPGWWTAPG